MHLMHEFARPNYRKCRTYKWQAQLCINQHDILENTKVPVLAGIFLRLSTTLD